MHPIGLSQCHSSDIVLCFLNKEKPRQDYIFTDWSAILDLYCKIIKENTYGETNQNFGKI